MNVKEVYAVKHKDISTRMQSRSGGIFTALSDTVLKKGGVIYGCILNEEFNAIHIRAETAEERNKMRGSKYIQSKIGNCYRQCADDLKANRMVLFSGTPCQIYGLVCFLKTLNVCTELLITVEILCHSVASPKVWHKYLEYQSNGKNIEKVDFRDKERFGWEAHKETLWIDNTTVSSDYYAKLFIGNFISSPCCYSCHFKNLNRHSDITIGDYWGINTLDPDFNDDKGVSFVMLNSENGKTVFEECKNSLECKKFPLVLSTQKVLKENNPYPNNRDAFFKDLDSMSFDKLYQKHTEKQVVKPKITFMKRVERRIFYYIEKVIYFGK